MDDTLKVPSLLKAKVTEFVKALLEHEDLQKEIQTYMDREESRLTPKGQSEWPPFRALSDYLTDAKNAEGSLIKDMQAMLDAAPEEQELRMRAIEQKCLSFADDSGRVNREYVTSMVKHIRDLVERFYREKLSFPEQMLKKDILDFMRTCSEEQKKYIDQQLQEFLELFIKLFCQNPSTPAASQRKGRAALDCTEDYWANWTQTPLKLAPEGVYLTLANVYQEPPILVCGKDSEETARTYVMDALKNDAVRMLTIFGPPGYGKSSLISSILGQMTETDEAQYDRTRVYRLAKLPCLQNIQADSVAQLPEQMLDNMGLTVADLEDSIVILDGLDEINLYSAFKDTPYIEFLLELHRQWIGLRKPRNMKLIVTCRSARIPPHDRPSIRRSGDMCDIELRTLSRKAIENFAASFWGHEDKEKLTEDQKDYLDKLTAYAAAAAKKDNIVGAPLILTMLLAQKIPVRPGMSFVSIYRDFFSVTDEEHSIYYRKLYGQESHHVTAPIAAMIHRLSQKVAFHMWRFAPDAAAISREDYQALAQEVICSARNDPAHNTAVQELTDDAWKDLSVGQYFTEGKNGYEILFLHRSIYEYFVALHLVDTVEACLQWEDPRKLFGDAEINAASPLRTLAVILTQRPLLDEPEIWTNVRQLLMPKGQDEAPLLAADYWNWWQAFFDLFREKGLAHIAQLAMYPQHPMHRESEIRRDARCLDNLLHLTCDRFLHPEKWQPNYWEKGTLPLYLRLSGIRHDLREVNLCYAWLKEADLHWANLTGARLDEAHLEGVQLEGADLRTAQLRKAHLERAFLKSAFLNWAFLPGAILKRTHLEGAILNWACLEQAQLQSVYLEHAHLEGVQLQNAHLEGAHLEGAHLQGAQLQRAHLTGTIIDGVIWDDAIIDSAEFDPGERPEIPHKTEE